MSSEKDGPGDGKVVQLSEKRKKKLDSNDKPSRKTILRDYLKVLSGERHLLWEIDTFPRHFENLTDESGNLSTVEILAGDIVRPRADHAVVVALLDFSRRLLTGKSSPELELTSKEATEVFKQWQAKKPLTVDEIKPVLLKSEPGLTWHRLDFDLASGPSPTFDELFGRVTNQANAKALKAFIGSLLISDSDRQQYVWLYGHGENGKGSLLSFLQRLFGPGFWAEHETRKRNQFWTASFLGRRLIAFPDFDNPKFVTEGIFKALTGGDAIRIENKGQAPQTVDLCCKFIFLANEAPEISSSKADQRRVIFCEIGPLSEGTVLLSKEAYGAKLWAEAPAFLMNCRETYQKVCGPEHRRIPVEQNEELVARAEGEFDAIFREYFVACDDKDLSQYVPIEFMQHVFKAKEIFSDVEKNKFYSWLKRVHGAERRRPWVIRKGEDGTEGRERPMRIFGLKCNAKTRRANAEMLGRLEF